jgi:4-amino-4-deoxy-L-arabinose transferase-like glycosyltransferase
MIGSESPVGSPAEAPGGVPQVESVDSPRLSRRPAALIAAFVAVATFALVQFATLARAPLMFVDEPWYMECAWTLANTGHTGSPAWTGLFGLERANVAYGHLYLALHGLFLRILGVNLYASRLPELLASFGVLALVFAISRFLSGKRAAMLATVLLALSYGFVWQSHDARAEMLLMLFVLGSLYVLLLAEKRLGWPLVLASGATLGLAFDVHLTALFFVPLVAGVLVLRRPSWPLPWLDLLVWLGGLALGLGWWVLGHVALDPGFFVYQWQHVWAHGRMTGGFTSYGGGWLHPLESLRSQFALYWSPPSNGRVAKLTVTATAMAVVVALGSLGVRAAKKDRSALTLLAMPLLLFVTMVAFGGNKTWAYAFLPLPFALMAVAGFVTGIERPAWRRVAYLLCTLFLLLEIAGAASILVTDQNRQARVGREVARLVPRGTPVVAEYHYWYELRDQPMVSVWGRWLAGSLEHWVLMRRAPYVLADVPATDEASIFHSMAPYLTPVQVFLYGDGKTVQAVLYRVDLERLERGTGETRP